VLFLRYLKIYIRYFITLYKSRTFWKLPVLRASKFHTQYQLTIGVNSLRTANLTKNWLFTENLSRIPYTVPN